jgi:uncharacterized protein with NAD-binding domain and iron-sulfur cluster
LSAADDPPRVAILGGGVAGMTAAMELSQPGWKQKYKSITVYQYGWRLGGKGASGRGVHGRIEEHGMHIWLGFYENAFRLMRECYAELGRDASSPIASFEQAFERASLFIVQEPRGDAWLPWMAEFSETDDMPGGADAAEPPSLWQLMIRGLRLALDYNRAARTTASDLEPALAVSLRPLAEGASRPRVTLSPAPEADLPALAEEGRALFSKLRLLVSDVIQLERAVAMAERLPLDPADHDPAHHELLRRRVERAREALRDMRRAPDDESDQARREWYLTEILLSVIRGLLADGVLGHPDGLDSIDQYDFSEWLIRHGASEESAYCGLVTTLMYDLPFAYEDGDPTKPAIGAGTALRGAIRTLFTYTGAIAWKMRAGMGDIVFAPMFEVLEDRGVEFKFFHRVDKLHPSDDGSGRVASIDIFRQADLKDHEAAYQPLIPVTGLPCWPNAPLNDRLAKPVDEEMESFWSAAEPVEKIVLRDGQHFDKVVLAIPVGAHPAHCQELMDKNPRWQAMVDNLGTIYTQAFQLWVKEDMHKLGCDWPPAVTGGYLEPFDTYADMRQLIEREDWPEGKVGAIAYFCNVMPTPRGFPSPADRAIPEDAAHRVKANALTFLRHAIAQLWPGGVLRYPTEFRWDLLVDDDEDRKGAARFDSQFWRANVDPSERYVQSLPGTSRYRLAPDDTGFDNLVFAGDWTRCGLNSGCVEAAVISGLLAAAAVNGEPPRRPIIGFDREGARHVF